MAYLDDEILRLQEIQRNRKPGDPDEKIHVVFSDRIAAERHARTDAGAGKKPQTRFTVSCDTHETWYELWKEYDRILGHVGNKTVALSIIIWWLRLLTSERLDKKISAGHET